MLPCSLPVHGTFHTLRLRRACQLTDAVGLSESTCPFAMAHPEESLRILRGTSHSLEGSEEHQCVGSRLSPRYVCSSAEAGVQRRRLARFLRGWASTEEAAASGRRV